MRWLFVLSLLGCAAPLPIERRDYMVSQVAARYREFYPADGDPDPARDSGLLAPRFGLPAIAQTGAPFEVVLLERGSPPSPNVQLCKEGNCWPVELAERQAVAVQQGIEEAHYRARSAAPPGAYDLRVQSPVDAPTTAPRAVWLRADDPAAPHALKVVTLNDLHIGKGVRHLEENLRKVLYDINQLQPDLVLVTGDLVNMGTEASQAPRAQKLLRGVNAPLVAIVGNHDLGFDSFSRAEYGPGWSNFARSFHPSLEMGFVLGGWRFVGFDSGPSTFTPRIMTRGLLPPAVAHLGAEMERASKDGHHGVILFSHTPTRATVAGDGPGPFARMKWGAAELEKLLLAASARGQRVLHLAGHTHWSDLFEDRDGKFVRWRSLSPCLKPIAGKAALITTQAAGHSGVTFKESAHGWGFTELLLPADANEAPRVAFHRYGLPDDPWQCHEPTAKAALANSP
jgi:hypothetical protein